MDDKRYSTIKSERNYSAVTASSVWISSELFAATHVIDGDNQTNPNSCLCCFASKNTDEQEWLLFDLGQDYCLLFLLF